MRTLLVTPATTGLVGTAKIEAAAVKHSIAELAYTLRGLHMNL